MAEVGGHAGAVGEDGEEQTACCDPSGGHHQPLDTASSPGRFRLPFYASPDSSNSEENHLEVTVAANNPSSSGRKYLTNRKTQRDMGETTPAATVTSLEQK